MTGQKAVDAIRLNIGEPTEANSRWTDVQILAMINRMFPVFARHIKSPTEKFTISGGTVAKQQEYDLTANTIEVYTITYDGQFIPKMEWREIVKYTTSTPVYSSPDVCYFRDDLANKKLGFWPIPNVASIVIQGNRVYPPDAIAVGGSMPYIESYQEMLIDLVTHKLLLPDFAKKSLPFKANYENERRQASLDKKADMQPDYVDYIGEE